MNFSLEVLIWQLHMCYFIESGRNYILLHITVILYFIFVSIYFTALLHHIKIPWMRDWCLLANKKCWYSSGHRYKFRPYTLQTFKCHCMWISNNLQLKAKLRHVCCTRQTIISTFTVATILCFHSNCIQYLLLSVTWSCSIQA